MSDRDTARPDEAAPAAEAQPPEPEQSDRPEPVNGSAVPVEPGDAASSPGERIDLTQPTKPVEIIPEPAEPAEAVPEPVDHIEPPLEPIPDLEPAPEPEAQPENAPEPIEVEPHTSVEAVAEPTGPVQIAPEPGAPPIPLEPEPSVPDPVPAEPVAPVALEPGTDETLALPPTTKAVEPPPVPSTPPPPTGVPVPFAAPPTERNGSRFALKLGLGIGGGGLLAVAVVVAVVMAFVTFTNSIAEEIQDTAAQFIDELADEDWDGAYAMLCEDLRDRPADDYIPEWESWSPATAEVQPLAFDDVDVRVRLADGSEIALVVQVDQTAETLGTSICGWYDVTA